MSDIFVVGDFNIKYDDNDSEYSKLNQLMHNERFHFILNSDSITTDHNSLIDLCFSTKISAIGNIFESVVSDHKPIWFEITQ